MKAKNRQYYRKYVVILILCLNLQFEVHERTPVSKCKYNFVLLNSEQKTTVFWMISYLPKKT